MLSDRYNKLITNLKIPEILKKLTGKFTISNYHVVLKKWVLKINKRNNNLSIIQLLRNIVNNEKS